MTFAGMGPRRVNRPFLYVKIQNLYMYAFLTVNYCFLEMIMPVRLVGILCVDR